MGDCCVPAKVTGQSEQDYGDGRARGIAATITLATIILRPNTGDTSHNKP